MSVIENLPALRPTLLLDFVNSRRVHPLVQCTRASTATCWGSDGQIRTVAAHVPRIEFDPATGRCLGLLVEESRTNLFTYSDTFSHGIWAKTNMTINEPADSLSISGLKFVVARETASAEAISKNLRRSFPQVFAAGSSVAITWFLAASSRRFCNVLASGLGGWTSSIALDLSTGEFQTRNAVTGWTWAVRKISDKVIAVTLTGINLSLATEAGAYIDVRPSNATSLAAVGAIGAQYAGDPAMGITVGPVQIEVGPCSTSYIPTGASATTRGADVMALDLASPPLSVVDGQGTFVASARTFAPAVAGSTRHRTLFSLNANYANDNISAIFQAASDLLSSEVRLGGVFQHAPGSAALPGTTYTRAISYKDGSIRSATDGALTASESAGLVPRALSKLDLGCRVGINQLNGYLSRLAYYPQPVSSNNLQGVSK